MSLIIPANTLASGGFAVDNSCRFDDGSSTQMNKSISSTSTTWTFSCWIKHNPTATNQYLASWDMGGGESLGIGIENTGTSTQLFIYTSSTGQAPKLYDGKLRDPSAWMNIVIKNSSGTITSYINGTQAKTSITGTALASGTLRIGCWTGSNFFYDGYMSEVVLIDGTAYNADSFGEFDEDSGIWKPIDVSGLTFGSDGFYLDFEDSANLGNDANGGTDLTEVNLAAIDQTTDTPTNNFATLNPLNNYWSEATFSEGNSVYTSNNTGDYYGVSTSTIGVSSGKWYFEAKNSTDSSGQGILGITSRNQTSRLTWLGSTTQAYGYYATGGVIRSNSADTSYGTSYTVNDIIGIYMDLDNNKMYVSDNGVLQNSGTGYTITAAASTDSGFYHFAVGDNSDNTQVWQCNFGGTSGFTVSSGNTDVNGYGNFEYDPSAGTFDGVSKDFLALCTKNLSEVLG
jgi:hypothetical protein